MTRTFAFDRRTGQLVDCCGANVNGDTSVRQTGLVGSVFPIGTQKQTYQVFDTTLNRPLPFVYAGTTTVRRHPGLRVRRERPADAVRHPVTVPGSMLGSQDGGRSRAPEFDQEHLIYYVDPETGALLNVNEQQTVTLHNPATGAAALVSSTPT